MKVLWFCNTTANAYPKEGVGGGWISSLEKIVLEHSQIELAISFENNHENRFCFGNSNSRTNYYPIKRYKPTALRKLYNNLSYKIDFKNDISSMLKVVADFKPDIIQIFGSEDFFCRIIGKTDVPIVIHLQGILHKYLEKFLPEGYSKLDLFSNTTIFNLLVGGGNYHSYHQLARKARREREQLAKARYFMGRTDWDKQVSLHLSPSAHYFHCEEALRAEFFDVAWNNLYSGNGKFKIATTINDNIYKGFDLILKTALILKMKGFNFEWNIYGIKQESAQVKLFENKLKIKSSDVAVNYHGPKTANELMVKLCDSNLFVHASHIDNSPNSVCEAMLLGMPVIAVNVGGLNSLIHDNVSGILTREYDADGLADKIVNLKDADTRYLSLNARAAALKRHNRDSILSQLTEVYNNISYKL